MQERIEIAKFADFRIRCDPLQLWLEYGKLSHDEYVIVGFSVLDQPIHRSFA